ncbi:MAG TPA: IclR family transcriptional regulator [Candidatus Acetothermia bacterium]|nr:IclR family transcriptional regulator [Candidatus Acetothermia bacterium]
MQALEKCLRILTQFGEGRGELSPADIARSLGLPRSTTYRYVLALKAQGLLEEDPRTGLLRLGGRLLQLAGGVRKRGLIEISRPVMERLATETGETFILAGRHEMGGICLERVEGHHALRVSLERGAIFPLHAGATGKVLLAHLPQDERERIIGQGLPRFTATTITDPKVLRAELRRIRRRGYAESDGEVLPHTYGLAMPILSDTGRILAALGVSAPSTRLDSARKTPVLERMTAAARAIARELAVHGQT